MKNISKVARERIWQLAHDRVWEKTTVQTRRHALKITNSVGRHPRHASWYGIKELTG